MIFTYILIVLLATTIGASTGLGGGVIIKPLFDLLNIHDTSAIGVYSAFAVFFMALVSLIRQFQAKVKFNYRLTLLVAIAAAGGGLIGDYLFSFIYAYFKNDIRIIQNLLLAVILAVLVVYTYNKDRLPHYRIKNPLLIFLSGLCLGIVSVFLGIGGGPLNLAVFSFLFALNTKESVVMSICVILCSQLTKLLTTFIKNQFLVYDMSIVPPLVITAIIGGLIGSALHRKMNHQQIDRLYLLTLLFLICLTLINILTALG